MGNEETLSKAETIRLIEEGDRYAGVKFEELKDDFKIIMETYDLLDLKIDRLETKVNANLEHLREEMNFKFSMLFDELRAMHKEISEKQNL